MGLLMFIGASLVGFSFPIALFVILVSKNAQLVVVTLCAAFFWLLALLSASLLWYIIPLLQESYWGIIILTVIFQEIFRYVFFHFYSKAERSFSVVSTNAIQFPLTDFYSATAAGLGFGGMYTVLMYGTIVSNSLGPGTVFADTCPHFSTFVSASGSALLFSILHLFLMIIAFEGYRLKQMLQIAAVVLLHLACALSITINQVPWYGCIIYFPVLTTLVLISAAIAGAIVSRPGYRSKRHVQ